MAKIIFRKNHKPLPHPLHLGLFLFVLGAICASLLAIVNGFTKGPIEEAKRRELEESLHTVGLVTVEEVTNNFTLLQGVSNIYYGQNEDGVNCYAIQVSSKNKYTVVVGIVLIDELAGTIKNVQVVGSSTTLGTDKDNAFLNSKFGVVGSTVDHAVDNFEIISGTTKTSESVKEIVKVSAQMYQNIILEVKNHE